MTNRIPRKLWSAVDRRMNQSDPFAWGWRHGFQTGTVCTRRDAENYFGTHRIVPLKPQFTSDEIDAYMNGRDDGVAGDVTRLLARP